MGGSETRRLVKEVSAGMMVFTKAPNALRGKERFPMEWEMDHVDGELFLTLFSCGADSVRHELHTPPPHGMTVVRART